MKSGVRPGIAAAPHLSEEGDLDDCLSLTVRAGCLQAQCGGSSAPARAPRLPAGPTQQLAPREPRAVCLQGGNCGGPACAAALPAPAAAAGWESFLALSPACFRLDEKLDILGHRHNWVAVWRLFRKERGAWSTETAEFCPFAHFSPFPRASCFFPLGQLPPQIKELPCLSLGAREGGTDPGLEWLSPWVCRGCAHLVRFLLSSPK